MKKETKNFTKKECCHPKWSKIQYKDTGTSLTRGGFYYQECKYCHLIRIIQER